MAIGESVNFRRSSAVLRQAAVFRRTQAFAVTLHFRLEAPPGGRRSEEPVAVDFAALNPPYLLQKRTMERQRRRRLTETRPSSARNQAFARADSGAFDTDSSR